MSILALGVLVYNQASFVDELLCSIKDQDSNDFRVFVLDNSSTDGSLEKLRDSIDKYALKERVNLFSNLSNTGSAQGLKQLLQLSECDYLAIAHGDDVLNPNYISECRRGLSAFPQAVALNVTLDGFSVNNGYRQRVRIYRSLWTKFDWINNLLVTGLNPGLMPGSVLKREFVLSNDLLEFSELVNGVEDSLLWMRIVRRGGKIRSISKPIYEYRLHEKQFSYEDGRNSYFFGLSRRLNILESKNLLHRILSKSEISYELKRFGQTSEYLLGLSRQFRPNFAYAPIRLFNILIRRMVTAFRLNIYT